MVSEGRLTQLYIEASETTNVSCIARSQDPVKVEWKNSQNPEWTRMVSILKNESHGNLNFSQEALLSIKPNATDIMAKLNCTKTGLRKNAVECPAKFLCKAYYGWNTSINDEKEIDAHFLVGKYIHSCRYTCNTLFVQVRLTPAFIIMDLLKMKILLVFIYFEILC